MEERTKRSELPIGSVIDNRWKIENLICKGSFGSCSYEVSDLKRLKERFLLKSEEKNDDNVSYNSREGIPKFLHMEIKLLMALKKLNSQYYLGLESGGETDRVRYLVTGLHGQNLHEIRLTLPEKHFTLQKSLHIAQQTLLCLEGIHKAGYVHRDVKPENMVIGRFAKDVQPIYIINYELCRKYLDERKNLRPLREKICFRGSPRYASIDALLGKDQERVDDMWSWFQSVIEMTVGKLPFNDENGIEFLPWIVARKEMAFKNPEIMLVGCPNEYRKVYDHLRTLTAVQQPNYSMILDAITESIQKNNKPVPVDWKQGITA